MQWALAQKGWRALLIRWGLLSAVWLVVAFVFATEIYLTARGAPIRISWADAASTRSAIGFLGLCFRPPPSSSRADFDSSATTGGATCSFTSRLCFSLPSLTKVWKCCSFQGHSFFRQAPE